MHFSKIFNVHCKLFFGSCPSQKDIDDFIKVHDIKLIVDLTEQDEPGVVPYQVDIDRLIFPITNGCPPSNWEEFFKLLIKISFYARKGAAIFIHCRAGHGRSGMVSASLLCQLDPHLHPENAIKLIAEVHSKREGLSLKWKKIYNPLSRMQRVFVYKYFSTIFFIHSTVSTYQIGLSTLSSHSVCLHDKLFPNAEAAFQYLKDPNDTHYTEKLLDPWRAPAVKLIGDDHWLRSNSNFCEFTSMYHVLKLKFTQHVSLRESLLKTFSKRLYDGNFLSHPDNLVGKILMQIREELAAESFVQDADV
jgi:predicted NAD-dependent protein-ADP-ribosyltransferase YbiA (DUF1768 family)